MKGEYCLGESDRDIFSNFQANSIVCLRKVILIVYDARTVVSDLFKLRSLAFLGLHLLSWRFGLWVDRLFWHRLLTFDLHQVPILKESSVYDREGNFWLGLGWNHIDPIIFDFQVVATLVI